LIYLLSTDYLDAQLAKQSITQQSIIHSAPAFIENKLPKISLKMQQI